MERAKGIMKTIIILLSVITLNCMGVTVSSNLLHAIAMVESGNRNGVMGDLHRKDGKYAYGCMQVRKPYLQDVMKFYGKECKAKYGRLLTLEDMKWSTDKSKWVVSKYLQYWGGVYEKRTGMKATPETLMRIHNGGPNSWDKKKFPSLYSSTSKYVNLVILYYKT
jgi:hypothetical protein